MKANGKQIRKTETESTLSRTKGKC